MQIHEAAARGFQQASEVYERGRPTYPPEAIDRLVAALGIEPGATVVDLAAGTGKLTRLLIPSGARLIAIEPVEAMRATFARVLPNIRILEGTAEEMPLAGASADALVVGQAFHWFDGPVALAEIHRVLRPGGHLGLIWNVRDENVDWMGQIAAITAPYRATAPSGGTGDWRTAFATTTLFTPLQEWHIPSWQDGDATTVLDRVASTSVIGALPEDERAAVLDRVRELLATHPDTRGRTALAIPYRTGVYWCARQADPRQGN